MKSIIFPAILLLLCNGLHAQDGKVVELSLKECVQTAIERNIHMVSARIDQEKSSYKVAETRASLLPNINVNGNFQDNLRLPTTVLPGDMLGMPGTSLPVKMGTEFNTTASVGITQVLYNQTAITALKLSRKSSELSSLGVEKASEELAHEIAKLYFLAQTTSEQISLIEDNITRTGKMAGIVKVLVDNGMGKQVDYDRINVNLQNLYTQLSNAEAAYEQQLNMMKYMLEIPAYETIVLTDTTNIPLLAGAPESISDFSPHIDIRMLESQQELNLLNQKMINHSYLPSLAFSGQFVYQGMRQDFKNYFRSNPENNWYNSSNIAVSLSIPIFDGLEKRSKSKQAKLDYQKTSATLANTKEQFNVNYINAQNNFYNNQNNLLRQRENITLAEKVYAETSLKYKEGLSSMSDLLQDEMGLSSAQSGYLSALYNLKESELEIMSLNGEIKGLINN